MKVFKTMLKQTIFFKFIFTSPATMLFFHRCQVSAKQSPKTSLCACALQHANFPANSLKIAYLGGKPLNWQVYTGHARTEVT